MIWAAGPSASYRSQSLSATTDQLSPYIATLRDDVDAVLRELFRVPPDVTVRWEAHCGDRSSPDGRVRATLSDGQGSVAVDVAVARRGTGRGLEVQRPRVAYRSLADLADSPDLVLARRLPLGPVRRDPALVKRAIEAIATWCRHDGVSDWMYRQLGQAGASSAVLRLGFRCNQRCGFCWQGREWPEPPSAYYERWIDEVAALGVPSLTFSGGEPTLHPDLAALVRRAASKSPSIGVGVQTNAIRLRDVAYLRGLIDAGLQVVLVSYHSADPDVSDAMTGAKGSHARTVEGIETCLRHHRFGKPEVRLNCLVERANVGALEDHARDVVRRFVAPFPAHPVSLVEYSHPNQSFDRDYWRRAVVPLDELRGPLVAAARTLRAAGVRVELFSGCGFPACALSGAPELIRSVAPARLDAKDLEGRAFGAACARCALRSACLGLRNEYVEVHGERGLSPFEAPPDGGPA
jgi:MoaA/NifB/PqqE/SkfB family radical SAM enzyme